jgi:predicted adenylyl cyclase CyaB
MPTLLAEAKARVEDHEAIRARLLREGAARERVVRQHDTFFAVARGRLKLRQEDGGALLVYYERPDVAGAKVSRVHLAPIDDARALATLLTAALGRVVVVHKRREIWRWEAVQVHLDAIDGLGRFIELEETVDREEALPAAIAHVLDLLARLAVPATALVATAYADLLARG